MVRQQNGIKNDIILKFIFLGVIILFLSIIVVGQIMHLQSIDPKKWENDIITVKEVPVEPSRGDICARDGRILATSMPSYKIRWDLSVPSDTIFKANIDTLSKLMSGLFGTCSAEDYKKEFIEARKNKDKYHKVCDRATVLQITKLKEFPIFKLGRYKSGLITELEYTRNKPHKNLATRTIGFLIQNKKNVGLEGAFNDLLTGRSGWKIMQKISSGDWYPISTFDDNGQVEPEDGCDIISTIDVTIQDLAEINLRKQLMSHNAKHGTVIVMEVKTGKIRAIANLDRKPDSTYAELYNHAVGTRSVPGSTFKLATLLVALEKGIVDIYDTIDTGEGTYTIGDFTITDDHKGGLGKISVAKAFASSSNVAFAKIVREGFKDAYSIYCDRLCAMHLNECTNIEIPGEVKPFIKSPDSREFEWTRVTPAQMGIGYELELTPLQVLTFYNAVANDGLYLRPTLLEAIRKQGKIISRSEPEIVGASICSRETIKKAQKLLQLVVDSGTAKNLKSPNYKFAGKTGTAQIAKDSDGNKSYQASFVGYFPADNPKYSCIVVISSPTEISYYGNSVAGPVFKAIADKLYASDYDIQRNKEFNLSKREDICVTPSTQIGEKVVLDRVFSTLNIQVENANEATTKYIFTRQDSEHKALELNPIANSAKGLVPNVVGMGAKDAVYNLEKHGIKVSINGRGTVKRQSVIPGTKITSGMKIVLDLG